MQKLNTYNCKIRNFTVQADLVIFGFVIFEFDYLHIKHWSDSQISGQNLQIQGSIL